MQTHRTPEQLIATLLDMRASLDPYDAHDRARALLAERGHDYDEDLWGTFFDPEESFANAMYDCGCALWASGGSEKRSVEIQAALLAFEAAKGAGLVLGAFAFAQGLDWVADDRAETELREFVTLHPDFEDPRLYGILGGLTANCYDDELHLLEALSFLDRVGDSEPVWIQWRALAIAKLGRPAEGIALLDEQVTAVDPDALRVLGDIHRASGDAESAQAAYLRAVAAGDEIASRRLAIEFEQQGDDHAATQAFAVAAARGDAYSASCLNDAGIARKQEGKIDEAVALFRLAWEAGDQDAGFNLALTLDQNGSNAEARRLWKVLADGGDVEAMMEYGEWAASDRDLPEARTSFRYVMDQGSPEQRATAAAHLAALEEDGDAGA